MLNPRVDSRKSHEVSGVACRHRDGIAWVSNQGGSRRNDGIGIRALASGRWQAAPAYIYPEISRRK